MIDAYILKKLAYSILLIVLLCLPEANLKSQEQNRVSENTGIFYFDAVVFDSDSAGLSRFDVFTIVPYASITFVRSGEVFGAEYQLVIKILNELGEPYKSETIERRISEKNYFVTQGGNADFDYSQTIFDVLPGKYTIEVTLYDKTGNKSYMLTRTQTVLDFDKYNFAASGLLYISAIEENMGDFIITPHVSDNIGMLSEYFFIFFESYNRFSMYNEVDFVYQIIDGNNQIFFTSEKIRKETPETRNQHYLRIPILATMPQGNYVFRIFALEPSDEGDFDERGIIASSERSLKYMKSSGSTFFAEIDDAIKQLRYIATQSEMDYMQSPENEFERQLRFEDFWKQHDPSPNTERNEAFDEYFYRIDYANRNFKSYTAGWRTDMGMTYIIYGSPINIDRNRMEDGRYYERWSYSNKTIVFVDFNGFGDFRLYSPMSISDKYKYN